MIQDMSKMIQHMGSSSKVVAREMAASWQPLSILMEQLRSSLGAGKEQARVWLGLSQSEASGLLVRSKRTPSPKQADSQSGVSGLRALRYAACMMMVMMGVNLWGQTPITSLSSIGSSGDYIITDDIDASGFTTSISSFTGTLTAQAKSDGTFPIISNLSVPIFTTATGATISNIMFKDITVSGSGSIGAICGTASGSTRIYNCGVLPKYPQFNDDTHSETSTVSSSDDYCGSLVGQLSDNARVINCFSYAPCPSCCRCRRSWVPRR